MDDGVRNLSRTVFLFRHFAPALLFLLLSGALLSLSGEEPDLVSGDNAFAAKDYAVAASFYTRYLNKLKSSPEGREKLREGYERLMDSLLFGGLTADAEKYLEEYRKFFPDAKELSVDMWQGELFLQKNLPAKALPLYEKILSALNGRDPRRLRALSSCARAQEALGRYREAAKTYGLLRELAGSSPMGKEAFVRQTLAAVCGGDFSSAEKLIGKADLLRDGGRTKTLLNAFYLLKKGGLAAGKAAWEKILSAPVRTVPPSGAKAPLPGSGKDPLLYLVAGAYGDAFFAGKDPDSAAKAYRAAYGAAGNNRELFQTLTRLIQTVEASGDTRKAADLAQKQADLFRQPLVDAASRLRIARILEEDKRNASAAELYESIFRDLGATKEQKKTSSRRYLLLKIRENKASQGISVLRNAFGKQDTAKEWELLIADTLAQGGLFQASLAVCEALGSSTPSMAQEAFYKAMRTALFLQDREASSRLYKKLLSCRPSSEDVLRELPFLEGAKAMLEGRKSAAEKLLVRYIGTRPEEGLRDLPEALRFCAVLALERKDYGQALRYLRRLTEEFPRQKGAPLAAFWVMHIYFLQNDELSAEQAAWALAGRYPDSDLVPDALLLLCRHYREKAAYNRAVAVLDRLKSLPAVKKKGRELEGRILYERGRIEESRGSRDAALKFYRETVEKIPYGPVYQEAGCRMGQLLYEAGRVDEALDAYTKASVAAKSDPLLTFAAQGALGNILLSAKSQDPESLRQALEGFLAIAGEGTAPAEFRAESAYKAGRCHELLGEKGEAENLYKQLLYAFPAKKILENPAVSLWCVKAAECLIDSAAKTPTLSAFENARSALHYLNDAGLISRKDAENRFEALKSMKFNP
ncbi:MAG: tetratricopeptide repeat protein [Lentisphaeria bacterium]|nr:tetratricopeptide repeat protein [Lentisphaeria bacterium]